MKITYLSVDYITVNFELRKKADLAHILSNFVTLMLDQRYEIKHKPMTIGKRVYTHSGSTPDGLVFNYAEPVIHPIDEYSSQRDINGHLRLQVPGKVLMGFDNAFKFAFILECLSFGASVSRVDLCCDVDRQLGLACMDEIKASLTSRDFVGFRKFDVSEPGDLTGRTGYQISLGSRESGSYVRIYDKFLESGGEFDCVRFEKELKRENLKAFLDYISKFPYKTSQFNECIKGVIFNGYDFRDRSSDSNISRCSRKQFWSVFLCLVESTPVRLKLPKPKRSLDKKRSWLSRQVAPSIAAFAIRYKNRPLSFVRYISDLVKEGAERLTQYDQLLINEELLRQDGSCITRLELQESSVLNFLENYAVC